MTEQRWTEYGGVATHLTTELNALANNANVLGSALDFNTGRKLYLDIELYLATVDLSGQTNPAIYLWMLRRTDGTNFEDGSSTVTPARLPDAILPLREFNGVHRVVAVRVLSSPDQMKMLIKNSSGAALAATGNTVKYRMYSEESI